MKDDVVRSVLKEYIEGDMPDKKDPWPIIRAMLPEGSAEHATTPTLGRTAESMIAKPPQARIQPGARKFRVNAAMALVALVVLAGLTISLVVMNRPIADPLPMMGVPTPTGREFLPAGMVRHMVLTGSLTTDGTALGGPVTTTEEHNEEFWLTQGQNHPLMKDVVTVPVSMTNWLDDSGYYEYDPANGNMINRSEYDPRLVVSLLPDPNIITRTLRLENAHLVGNDTLDGRPVVVITTENDVTPSPTPKDLTSYKHVVVTYWIDHEANQLLKYSAETTTIGGTQDGLKDTVVNKIALDELLPRSNFPADFFTFKLPEGAVLVEEQTPTPDPPSAPGKP
ncbi:MAG TPA: hypothetical protein VLQ48_02920 [Chloroflexia bacterium]|nr:hypothetical protein [Chloroflexia bacterium]